MPEQVLGWFPKGLGLVMEDEQYNYIPITVANSLYRDYSSCRDCVSMPQKTSNHLSPTLRRSLSVQEVFSGLKKT